MGTSAKEYIVRQLASSRGWSRASEIAEEIIRMSVLCGKKEYIAESINGEINADRKQDAEISQRTRNLTA